MTKPILYKNLRLNSAFTPAFTPVDNGVYVKKENGVCPLVSKENRWVEKHNLGKTYELQGVFYPEDRVYPINVPASILYHYR